MAIVKINNSVNSAYEAIKKSMSSKNDTNVNNCLDACGCTGNGYC